jgi:hypothetical protein
MFEIVLALTPLLLLVAALLCGRYPGIEAIERFSARSCAPACPEAAPAEPRPRSPRARTARGGLLLAFGFAQRPPPLAA